MKITIKLSNGDKVEAPGISLAVVDEVRRTLSRGPGVLGIDQGGGTSVLLNTIHVISVLVEQ